MWKSRILMVIFALVISLSFLVSSCGTKEENVSPADFYKGKTIELSITTAAGGASDLEARIFGKYFAELTGAKVVPYNRTGAEGIEAFNSVWNSKPDGLSWAYGGANDLALWEIFEEPAAQFEPEKFTYVFGLPTMPIAFSVGWDSPLNSIEALKAAKNLVLPASSAHSDYALRMLAVCKILGLDAKVIQVNFADGPIKIAQGELSAGAFNAVWVERIIGAKQAKPIFIIGSERMVAYPDIPALTELVKVTSSEDKRLIELSDTLLSGIHMLVMPPGVPKERAEFVEATLKKIVEDHREEIEKAFRGPIKSTFSGADLEKMLKSNLEKSDELRAIFDDLSAKYWR